MNFLKKSAILLITFFYSVCVVGMSVNVHYCHGKISSVSLDFSKSDCCCEKDKKAKKCCSDKEVELKIDNKDLRVSENKTSTEKPSETSLPKTFLVNSATKTPETTAAQNNYHIPLLYISQRYLKCCVFRI